MKAAQNRLNKNDVRKGVFRFILSFIILSGITFLSVFLFYNSSAAQQKYVKKQMEDYKQMITKSEQLDAKFNDIYSDMMLLSNNKVDNDIYLSNKIVEDIRDCRNVIGTDSVKNFKQHASFIKNIEKDMMPLKNELISINIKEQAAERKLYECTGKVKRKIQNDIPPIVKNFN